MNECKCDLVGTLTAEETLTGFMSADGCMSGEINEEFDVSTVYHEVSNEYGGITIVIGG